MARILVFQYRKNGGEWKVGQINFDTWKVSFIDTAGDYMSRLVPSGSPKFFLESDMFLSYYEEKELYIEPFTFDEAVSRFKIPWERTPRCAPKKDYVGIEYQCISKITDL